MTEQPDQEPELASLGTVLADRERLVRAVASGRRKGYEPPWRRVELRWVSLKAGPRLQVVAYDAQQAFTRNVTPDDAASEAAALADLGFASWHVETQNEVLQLRYTKKDRLVVQRSAQRAPTPGTAAAAHDRGKSRFLSTDEDFLRVLGITTGAGEVRASRRDKLMQVEAFLRALEPVVAPARESAQSGGRPLQVVDLGCGNAYLSLATYHWLHEHHGLETRVTGVDAKAQAREHNTAVAHELGWGGQLRFVEATIAEADVATPPDLVLALHACDTATDDALAWAVRREAPVVLAAPCCHHDLQRQLKAAGTPSPYGPLTRHGILRERFADVLTDAVRAAVLRLVGYRVEVVEFVGSTHTPRNTLLRAVRTGARPTAEQVAEYHALVGQWQIRPALAVALEDRLP